MTVKKFEAQPNAAVAVAGDLNEGATMTDLSWAWNSSNACFPETQVKKYKGNHVLYFTQIPKYSVMVIKLIPTDESANFSLYAYSTNKSKPSIVPQLPSCVSCEADHVWDRQWKGKTQDHTRSVELRAINNPYGVIIGVVGGDGQTEGAYTIEVSLKTR